MLRRRRKKAAKPDGLRNAIQALVCALREQPGLNVRLPSHHAAPYRAVQWTYTDRVIVAADSGVGLANPPVFLNLRFTGRGSTAAAAPGDALEEFPEGHLGELAYFRVWAMTPGGATALNFDAALVTLLRSGAPVPGWEQIRPSNFQVQLSGAGGGSNALEVPLVVPVHLQPGVTLEVRMENLITPGPQNVEFVVIAAGWMYPAKRAEPSIFGTLVD